MTNLSTCRRDPASCPWIKQSHLEKCSNAKLHTSTLANNGTLTVDFASTLSNVNNVKTSDLLEFLVMLLLSPHCFHQKKNWQKVARLWKHPWGESFLITRKNLFFIFTSNFAKTYVSNYFPMKLPLATRKKVIN